MTNSRQAEVTENVFATPWFRVVAKTVLTEDGRAGAEPYFVVQPPDYVSILALTANQDVLLIRQYRPAAERMMLELPSGYIDSGEQPEQAARRELLEETGYQARRFELLGNLAPDAGRLGNRLYTYMAQNVRRDQAEWQAEPGNELVVCPVRDLVQLSRSGEFDHALNLASLWLALARYGADPFDWQFE